MEPVDINKSIELNLIAKEDGRRYTKKRLLYDKLITQTGRHFTGIVGPRGAGKTVLLKQIASQVDDSFYLSVDTIEDQNLFDIAKILTDKYKVKYLLLDEIHFWKNFEGDLKKIYDFLNPKIIFTSSVALTMIESAHDLSRRVELHTLYPFSFREYLFFKKDIQLPTISLNDIVHEKWTPEHLEQGYLFDEYLKGGVYPFALEELDPLPLLKNIIQKIVHKDIPQIARLKTDEIGVIEKMLEFIGRSFVDGINYSSVSAGVGITKYKAEQYIGLLQKSFVLNPIFPLGTNVTKEPKVLMYLPYRLLYKTYDEAIGSIREDFFAETMLISNNSFSYLKSKRGAKTPDYLVKGNNLELVIEIGGKGKGIGQFKDITAKNKIRLVHSDETRGNKRPLFLIGYLV